MEKGWNGLKMAGHLMVATIGSPGTVSNGPTSFWAEPELDSFFFGPKWECFEQQHYIVPEGSEVRELELKLRIRSL